MNIYIYKRAKQTSAYIYMYIYICRCLLSPLMADHGIYGRSQWTIRGIQYA